MLWIICLCVCQVTMVEVHEEDKEYAGGAVFVGSRAELREALARVTLQKVRGRSMCMRRQLFTPTHTPTHIHTYR